MSMNSPPPSLGVMHPNKEEVRKTCQEIRMDEQGAPGQAQTQKEALNSEASGTYNLLILNKDQFRK